MLKHMWEGKSTITLVPVAEVFLAEAGFFHLGESASSAFMPGAARISYLTTQMSSACAHGHIRTECRVHAGSDGVEEVCETELMQCRAGRVMCCVSLQGKL